MADTIEERAREYAHKNFADYLCEPVTAVLITFARAELARAAPGIRAAALREVEAQLKYPGWPAVPLWVSAMADETDSKDS